MTTKLLGTVGLSLVLALSSSAWAGAENTFSPGATTTTNSNAAAVATGSSQATSISESYNTSIEGVATQTLSGIVADTTTHIEGNGLIQAGSAYAGTGSGTVHGVAQSGANSGIGGIVQQGIVFATGGAVNF